MTNIITNEIPQLLLYQSYVLTAVTHCIRNVPRWDFTSDFNLQPKQ